MSETMSPESRVLRSRKAVAVREGRLEDAAALDTELRGSRIIDLVAARLAAGPVTEEQRLRIARLVIGAK